MINLLVTPSYASDYQRCKRLIESSERWVTGIDKHLIIIDEKDATIFRPLQHQHTERLEIVTKEQLLPEWIWRIPGQKRWWLTRCSLPVRGWIMQQIVKLYVAYRSKADAVIFADSDLYFTDSFDANKLWQQDRLRLYKNKRGPNLYNDRRYQNWYQMGCDLLQLGEQSQQHGAYIAQLNAMRPCNVRRLAAVIEQQQQMPWVRALLRCQDFSEFILYGQFIDCLGEEASGHFMDDSQLVHSSWFHDIRTDTDLQQFLVDQPAHQCAVHVQSNLLISNSTQVSNMIRHQDIKSHEGAC